MKFFTLKRVLIGLAIAIALMTGGAFAAYRHLQGGVDYSSVASIKHDRAYQDPALLAKAWALPVAAIYQHDGVDYQHNPSFCGPTSAVNVLRSLGKTSGQSTILDGSGLRTIFGLLPGGVTLDEVAKLLRDKSSRPVEVLRDLDLSAFRAELRKVNDPANRYIINFHRGPLFGAGGGHFSPIAGYLEAEDLVLVLDVNERYKPWLTSSARLFAAMDTMDRSSGKKRGLAVVHADATH